jgi:hypothetical protein
MVHNLHYEIDPHRHLRIEPGKNLQIVMFFDKNKIRETHQTIRSASPNFKVITCYKRKRKKDNLLKNCMFKLKINLDRHDPRPLSNI